MKWNQSHTQDYNRGVTPKTVKESRPLNPLWMWESPMLVHPPFISQLLVSYSVDCKSRSYDPDVSRDMIASSA